MLRSRYRRIVLFFTRVVASLIVWVLTSGVQLYLAGHVTFGGVLCVCAGVTLVWVILAK